MSKKLSDRVNAMKFMKRHQDAADATSVANTHETINKWHTETSLAYAREDKKKSLEQSVYNISKDIIESVKIQVRARRSFGGFNATMEKVHEDIALVINPRKRDLDESIDDDEWKDRYKVYIGKNDEVSLRKKKKSRRN